MKPGYADDDPRPRVVTLTPKQAEALAWVKRRQAQGDTTTQQELAKHLGISVSAGNQRMSRLIYKGVLSRKFAQVGVRVMPNIIIRVDETIAYKRKDHHHG